MDLLWAFIEEEKEKPFIWGKTDCASTANRWVILKTGIDPMLDRKHTTEQEAKEWLMERGNLFKAVSEVIDNAGFLRTTEPSIGDVGLIACNKKLHVAIFTGNFWFSRDETGCLGVQNVPFRAWEIE